MGIAGTDLVMKLFGTTALLVVIWIAFSSGVATRITFSSVKWYIWAIILVIFLFYITSKKK